MKRIFHKILKAIRKNKPAKYLFFKLFKPTLKVIDHIPDEYYTFKNSEAPFNNYTTTKFQSFVNDSFNSLSSTLEKEYVISYPEKVVIEPYTGWCLDSKCRIIKDSLPYFDISVPIPHFIYYKRKYYRLIEKAVYIRYNWYNYWHFMNDIMGQFQMLESHQIDNSVPIIIPEKALDFKYVKAFMETDYAKSKKWIFQKKHEYLEVKHIIFCKSIPNTKKTLLFGTIKFNEFFSINRNKNRELKLFINRNRDRGRHISNINEIVNILTSNGFLIIDNDQLSIKEQIYLFSSAKIIIGIHGAGLTNMTYSFPEKIKILELFPPNHAPTHYFWLAKELGFSYDCIMGTKYDNNSFIICKDELSNKLIKLDA